MAAHSSSTCFASPSARIVLYGTLVLMAATANAVAASTSLELRTPENTAPRVPVEIKITAPASSHLPVTEIAIFAVDNSNYDRWVNPPALTLTRNGVDVSSWLSWQNFNGGAYDTDGLVFVYRGDFTLVSGSNVLVAKLCGAFEPTNCLADTTTVIYTGPASLPTQAKPIATLAQSNTSRQLDACASCASRTAEYSTPAEFVNGGAVATTLHYSTESSMPTGFVEVDVKVPSTGVPTRLSIRLRRNGAFVTLSNGATEAFVLGDTALVRLGAQFNAGPYATGAYVFDVIIGSYWASGTPYLSDTIQARVLIQNEVSSTYGRGWTVAGVPRVFHQPDGSVVITDGTGAIDFYEVLSCNAPTYECVYAPPKGSFAQLRANTPGLPSGITWRLTDPSGSTLDFGGDGLLRTARDRFENVSLVTHDFPGSGPRVSQVTSRIGNGASSVDRTTSFGYHATTGKLSTITLADGRQSAFTVSSGNLVTVTDPDGVTALAATYSGERLVKVSGRNGAADTVLFDAFGQLAEHRTPAVVTETHGSVRVPTLVNSLRARLLTGQGTASTGSAAAAVRPDSAFTRMIDPTGTTTTVWMHESGAASRTETRDLAGRTIYSAAWFDGDYRPIATKGTGSGGTLTFWNGPVAVRNLQLDMFSARDSRMTYGKYSQLDSTFLNGELVSLQHFSGDSLAPDSVWSVASNETRRFRYDGSGRVVSSRSSRFPQTVDSLTYESTFGNVALRRRIVQGSVLSSISLSYDGSGRAYQRIDALGNSSTTFYDRLNRDTLTIAPLGARTRIKYEDPQRRITLTDPMGQVYVDSLNALGWVVRSRDPRGNSDSFGYDRIGQVVRKTDRNSQVTTTTYDSLGYMTRRIAGADTTYYSVNHQGAWVVAQNSVSLDTIYFALFDDRRVKETTVRSGNRLDVSTSYTENSSLPSGATVRRLSGTPWTREWSVGWNAQYARTAITDFAGKVTPLNYTSNGTFSFAQTPGGWQSYIRDLAARPHTIYYGTSSQNATLKRTLTRDAADRVTNEARSTHGRAISYDALGRVASYADTSQSSWQEEVCFENRLGEIHCDSSIHYVVDTLAFAVYAYDSLANRRDRNATLAIGNRVTAVDGYSITYDSAGRILQKAKALDTLKFNWDVLGQLKQVVSFKNYLTHTTTYEYDGFGRRIRRVANGATTNYLWDADRVIMELDASYNPTAEYTYYGGTDRPHSVRRAGKMYYFAQDLTGNVLGLIDTAGAVVARYEYSPYGELLSSTELFANPYQFKGREWDREARLYFVRARYYDPHLGRFISEDPIGLAGGINLYAYAMGDPVNGWDPSGLAADPCASWVASNGAWVVWCPRMSPGERCQERVFDVRCLDEMGSGPWHRDPSWDWETQPVADLSPNRPHDTGPMLLQEFQGSLCFATGLSVTVGGYLARDGSIGTYWALNVCFGVDIGVTRGAGRSSSLEALRGTASTLCIGFLGGNCTSFGRREVAATVFSGGFRASAAAHLPLKSFIGRPARLRR